VCRAMSFSKSERFILAMSSLHTIICIALIGSFHFSEVASASDATRPKYVFLHAVARHTYRDHGGRVGIEYLSGLSIQELLDKGAVFPPDSVVVAHQATNAAGEPLIDSVFVNATLVLVVASCIAGPILTAHYGKHIIAQAVGAEPLPAA
jgi:hypothetical protein